MDSSDSLTLREEDASPLNPARPHLVYVRLSSDDGRLEVVARTTTARPTPQVLAPVLPAL